VLPFQLRVPAYHATKIPGNPTYSKLTFKPDPEQPGHLLLLLNSVEAGHFPADKCAKISKSAFKKRQNLPNTRSVSFGTFEGKFCAQPSPRSCGCHKTSRAAMLPTVPEIATDGGNFSVCVCFRDLERALGVKAKVWIESQRVECGKAIPAVPTLPDSAATETKGIKRRSPTSTHLQRTATAAPAQMPVASHFLHYPAPPKLKSTAKLSDTKAKKFQSKFCSYLEHVDISSGHLGPFFALPGDELGTLLFGEALRSADPDLPHPLGLRPGDRVNTIEFNEEIGGVRMLTSEGWKFASVSLQQLDAVGLLEHQGKFCSDFELGAEGPPGWRWEQGRMMSE